MSAADSSTSDSGDSSHEPLGRIVSPAQVRRMLRARRDWPNRRRKLDRMREEYARCKSYRPRRPSAIRHAEAIVHKRNDLPKIRASARFVRFPSPYRRAPAQASFVEPGFPAPVHPGIDRPLVGEHTPRTGTAS